jgi:hypothetical protein
VLATQVDGELGPAEQHAARLLARCEGAATPPVRTLAARVRLTPGELDIALQAAAGDLYPGADPSKVTFSASTGNWASPDA